MLDLGQDVYTQNCANPLWYLTTAFGMMLKAVLFSGSLIALCKKNSIFLKITVKKASKIFLSHLNLYYLLCKTKEQRALFIQGFDKAMDLDRLEGNA